MPAVSLRRNKAVKKEDLDDIIRDFSTVSHIAGVPVTQQYIRIEFQHAPRKRPRSLSFMPLGTFIRRQGGLI